MGSDLPLPTLPILQRTRAGFRDRIPTAGGWALALSVPGPLCRKDRHSSLVRPLETLLLARDNGLGNGLTG